MKITSYMCDLCKTKYDAEYLIGFEFGPASRLVVKNQHNVERHWCKLCANAVYDMTHCREFSDFMNLKKD